MLAAVCPAEAMERTREAFERHARGEWVMPAKVYLDSPPGDFRAMPARGAGVALLKWVTSYPDNPERGLPVVTGVIVLSDADSGAELAILDARSVTWLRTGAAAAVSAQALAAQGAKSVGLIGCGVNGAWAARCLAAAGSAPASATTATPTAAERLAAELGWSAGSREQAIAADVVVTCTPGNEPVIAPPTCAGPAHRGARRRRSRQGRARARRAARAAGSSATSGSRRAAAASSRAPSRRARSAAATSPSSARC